MSKQQLAQKLRPPLVLKGAAVQRRCTYFVLSLSRSLALGRPTLPQVGTRRLDQNV
jgi:hypothetical protein